MTILLSCIVIYVLDGSHLITFYALVQSDETQKLSINLQTKNRNTKL